MQRLSSPKNFYPSSGLKLTKKKAANDLSIQKTFRFFGDQTTCRSREALFSRSPVLSPTQLESRERLKHINYFKLNTKELKTQITNFKQKLTEKLTKSSETQLKKFEKNGLFSKELNQLRQVTRKEVDLNKQ